MFGATLDSHGLVFGDECRAFTLTAGFEEGAAAGVLESELVGEDLSHPTFDLDRARVRCRGERDSGRRRIGGRQAAMCQCLVAMVTMPTLNAKIATAAAVLMASLGSAASRCDRRREHNSAKQCAHGDRPVASIEGGPNVSRRLR